MFPQRLDVAQTGRLGLEPGILTGREAGVGDLGRLEPKHLELSFQRPSITAEGSQPPPHFHEAFPGLRVARASLPTGGFERLIDQGTDRLGLGEEHPILLTHDVDGTFGAIGEGARRGHGPIDVRPGLPTTDPATEHDLLAAEDETSFHEGFVTERAHLILPGLFSAEEPKGPQEQGLARARLTGHHDEAGPGFEARRIDEAQVRDGDFFEHGVLLRVSAIGREHVGHHRGGLGRESVAPWAAMDPTAHTPHAESPTVIVSRRVLPGADADFQSWALRIRDAAHGFPGYRGAESQPPDANHPDEWVTAYSFATADQLDAWLTSSIRAALIDEVTELLATPPREQRVAGLRLAPEPVTAVFSQRVRPGSEAAFEELFADVATVLRTFDGFLASDVLTPVDGVQSDHVVVVAFGSRRQLDAWLEAPQRREWLERIEPLIEGDREMSVVGGFGGWFSGNKAHPAGPARWKQAVAVLLALYPTALSVGWVLRTVAPDLPFAVSMLIANIVGVAALTWLLMPLVTKALAPWLSR